MKSRSMFAAILGMMMLVPSTGIMAQNEVKVTLNDKPISFTDAAPFIDTNNRTLVPLRLISEELGAKVAWDKESQSVTVISEGTKAVLTLGQAQLSVDGKMQEMDTTPILKDNHVFVPIKYIGAVLDVHIEWIKDKGTVAISNELAANTVIAKVGDLDVTVREVMTQFNYEMALAQYQSQYDASYFETPEAKAYMQQRKLEIVDAIIKNKVVAVKGEELKLEPTTAEIETAFNSIKSNYQNEEQFNEALSQMGMTAAEYKSTILKENLTITNVVDYMSKKVNITDAQLTQYYNENSADYTQPAGANMAHILVATEEEAKAVKAEYDAGASFADLAKKYGTDGTKETGGELGYIPYDSRSYDQDFLEGAKPLEEGQVSDPVQTQFGWHLIKVTNVHKDVYTIPLEEIKEDVKSAALATEINTIMNDQVRQWEKEVKIERYESLINRL